MGMTLHWVSLPSRVFHAHLTGTGPFRQFTTAVRLEVLIQQNCDGAGVRSSSY